MPVRNTLPLAKRIRGRSRGGPRLDPLPQNTRRPPWKRGTDVETPGTRAPRAVSTCIRIRAVQCRADSICYSSTTAAFDLRQPSLRDRSL